MSPHLPLRVFVLGSFRDFQPSRSRSLEILQRLVRALRTRGLDAFLSGDARSVELAGGRLPPRVMTEALEPLADLALYVASKEGRGDGWVSELTAMQIKHPQWSAKRVLLLETGYPLTAILDPGQQGYLGDPAVMIAVWSDEEDLLTLANDCAFHIARYGELPPAPR